jgi:hypothetical protein
MKLKSFSITLLSIIVAIFWISFQFFLRFFIKRTAYKITPLALKISAMIPCGLILLHLKILYTSLRIILKYPPNADSILITYIKKIADIIYWNPLKRFHDNVIINIPYSGYVLEDITERLFRFCTSSFKVIFIVSLCDYIPRVIIATAFIYDVLHHQFAYLYIFLVLLIFPTCFQAFLYIMYNFSIRNRTSLEQELDVSYNVLDDSYNFMWKPGVILDYKAFQEYQQYWISFNEYVTLYTTLKEYKEAYSPYVFLYTSLCYIIGWSYYIYIVIT